MDSYINYYDSSYVNLYRPINELDTSKITDMSGLFMNTLFNGYIMIGMFLM